MKDLTELTMDKDIDVDVAVHISYTHDCNCREDTERIVKMTISVPESQLRFFVFNEKKVLNITSVHNDVELPKLDCGHGCEQFVKVLYAEIASETPKVEKSERKRSPNSDDDS